VSLSKIEIKKGKEREQKIDTYNITSTRQEFISNIEKTTDNKYLPLVFKLETLKLNKEFEGSTPLSNSEILNVIEFFKNVENYVDNSILRDEKFVSLVFSDKQEKGIKPLYASIRKLVESIKYPKFSNQYFEEL
jgi:hypothetical protein